MSTSSPLAKRKRDYLQLARQRCVACYAEWSLSSYFYDLDADQAASLARASALRLYVDSADTRAWKNERKKRENCKSESERARGER